MPADESESYRLDSLHELDRILYRKNILAPIEDLPGTRILDLGTGSGTQTAREKRLNWKGIWAIQVADDYAHALVKGMDLAPIQPTYVPLNCSFYVGDMTEDLDERTFPDGSIDLVHLRFIPTRLETDDARHIRSGVKIIKWPALLRNIFRMLKPGNGWIQLGELGTSATTANPPESSALWQVIPP